MTPAETEDDAFARPQTAHGGVWWRCYALEINLDTGATNAVRDEAGDHAHETGAGCCGLIPAVADGAMDRGKGVAVVRETQREEARGEA